MVTGLPTTDLISTVLRLRQSSAESVVTGTEHSSFQAGLQILHSIEEYLIQIVQENVGRPAEVRSYDLIVLAGNAGDGKSALLSSALAHVQPDRVEVIADATHTEHPTERLSQRLLRFFAPFAEGAQRPDNLHLIAMNTGAVLRFFDGSSLTVQPQDFNGLKTTVFTALQLPGATDGALNSRILVLNLDMRRLLGLPSEGHSFFRDMVTKLDPAAEFLAPTAEHCNVCAQRDWCFVHFNLTALQDPVVQMNLETLLWQIELAGVHLNPRNLWDFLSHTVAGDSDFFLANQSQSPCEAVAALKQSGNYLTLYRRLFFNLLFDSPGYEAAKSGHVTAALQELDPATQVSKAIHQLTSDVLVHPAGEAERIAGLGSTCRRHPVLDTVAAWFRSGDVLTDNLVELGDSAVRRQFFFVSASSAPQLTAGHREQTVDEQDLSEFLRLLQEYRHFTGSAGRPSVPTPSLNRFPADAGELFGQVFGRHVRGRLYIQLEGPVHNAMVPVWVEVPPFERGALGYRKDRRFLSAAEDMLNALHALPQSLNMQLGDGEPIHFDLTLTVFRLIQRVRRGYLASKSDLSDLFYLRYAIQRWARYRAEQGEGVLIQEGDRFLEGFRTVTGEIAWRGGEP